MNREWERELVRRGAVDEREEICEYLKELADVYRGNGAPSSADALMLARERITDGWHEHRPRQRQTVLRAVKRTEGT